MAEMEEQLALMMNSSDGMMNDLSSTSLATHDLDQLHNETYNESDIELMFALDVQRTQASMDVFNLNSPKILGRSLNEEKKEELKFKSCTLAAES